MFEKILQKLKSQRAENSSVSDRTLEEQAKFYEPLITSDESLEKMDFTHVIKSIEGNINNYTATVVKKTKEDAEKAKADEVARKKAEDDDKKKAKANKDAGIPDYVQEIKDQNKKLIENQQNISTELSALKTDKVKSSRKSKIDTALKELPEYYRNTVIESFERSSFDSDEDFNSYLEKTKTNANSFLESAKQAGIKHTLPSGNVKKPDNQGGTPVLNDAREILQKHKEKQKNN